VKSGLYASGAPAVDSQGMDLSRTANIADLRELARRRLPRIVFDFFDGGAEDEVTLRDNRAAFERIRLAPRVLRDVAKRPRYWAHRRSIRC